MNIENIFIIIIAALVGFGYLIYIRSRDMYEKEPIGKLLVVTIAGGFISILTSMAAYQFIQADKNFVDAVIKIGPIEESAKFLALILLYRLIKKEFNEIVDGIIYITAISLGFSIIENIFYAIRSADPFQTLFLRSIFSVIGHITFTGYIGIAFYIHKRIHKNYLGIVIAIAWASLAHGLFDGIIFLKELNGFFRFVLIGLVTFQIWLLKIALAFSTFRKELVIDLFQSTGHETHFYCAKCDQSIKTEELAFGKIKAGICGDCNNILFNKDGIRRLSEYFRPTINSKEFAWEYHLTDRIINLDDEKKIFYNTKRETLSADIDALGNWLKEKVISDKANVIENTVHGQIFAYLGLKYLNLKDDAGVIKEETVV